jgi:cell wall assembly regulator SMI1
MRDLWDRLERWITENVPEWLEQLNPGASEEEIAKAERELGVRFPEDFRESLKIHNGEKPGGIGIIEGF